MSLNEKDIEQLATIVREGFKELEGQVREISKDVADIKMGRAKEEGFEIKEKVSRNADEIKSLNDWKIEVDPVLKNLRRVVWGLLAAVGGAFLTAVVTLIIYWVTHEK